MFVREPWTDLSKGSLTSRADERIERKASRAKVLRLVHAFVDARDKGRCRACERRVSPSSSVLELRAERHHVVLRSAGGGNTTGNLAILCGSCHSARHRYVLTCLGDANARLTFSTEQKTWTSDPPK